MKYCSHCGKEVQDNAEICMNCGCNVATKHSITLKRESQWFLVNPAIKVEITGQNFKQELALKSGDIESVTLPDGHYHIHAHSSMKKQHLDVNLNKNLTIKYNRFRITKL